MTTRITQASAKKNRPMDLPRLSCLSGRLSLISFFLSEIPRLEKRAVNVLTGPISQKIRVQKYLRMVSILASS